MRGFYIDQDAIIVATLPNTVRSQPYSLGSWVMCLDRPGSVTLEKVELVKRHGDIALQAFSSRTQSREYPMPGNANAPLRELGFPVPGSAVTGV